MLTVFFKNHKYCKIKLRTRLEKINFFTAFALLYPKQVVKFYKTLILGKLRGLFLQSTET